MEENIASDPYLRMQELEYVFPDGLVIVVEERKPCAAFAFSDAYIVSDAEGNILAVEEKQEDFDYPVITGVNVTEFDVGYPIRTDDTFKFSVMKDFLACLGKYELESQLSNIDLTDVNNILLTTKTGTQIVIGQSDMLEEKLHLVASVLPILDKEGKWGGTLNVSTGEEASYLPGEDSQTGNPESEIYY